MKRIIWIILSLLIIVTPVLYSVFNELEPYQKKIWIEIIKASFQYISVFFIISVIFLIIRENANPIKTLAWIQILIFLPIAGFILYLFFGINYRKKKIFSRKTRADEISIDNFLETLIPYQKEQLDLKEKDSSLKSRLITLMKNNDKAILSWHNQAEIFYTGKEVINQLFIDITEAKHSIHLEFFSIHNDETGILLKELLIERALKGVEVRVIYDAVGSWRLGQKFWKDLIKAGGNCYPFLPVYFPFLSSKLNYRNHRKIAIIDNETGYIGGTNIGNKYKGLSKHFGEWHDAHLRIYGEAVLLLQKMFLLDWSFVSEESLFNRKYFTLPIQTNYLPMQIVSSGPDSDWENILQVYFTMISCAQKNIYIQTPYMVLDESLIMALKTASLSGLDVRIILPHKPDHKLVFHSSRSYYTELLSSQVKIYEYKAGFIHSKLLLIDDEIVSVGTANMDLRSFTQNFEINALIYQKEFIHQVKERFLSDLKECVEIDLEEFKKRNYLLKLSESFARLFSPVL